MIHLVSLEMVVVDDNYMYEYEVLLFLLLLLLALVVVVGTKVKRM